MADVLSKLQTFLLDQARRPFAWGSYDCALFLADWVWFAQGGADPAAAVRGTYSTQEGAAAILDAAGGFQACIATLASSAGCLPCDDPQDGDFGIVDMPGGLTGAVRTNGSWAFRTNRGMAWSKIAPGRLVKAWRLNA